jgi:hypothetical protein
MQGPPSFARVQTLHEEIPIIGYCGRIASMLASWWVRYAGRTAKKEHFAEHIKVAYLDP